MKYIQDHEGYEDLANAIIIRAAMDYRNACKKYKKGNIQSLRRIKETEKFFNSKWASALSYGKAKEVFRRLQKEQEEKAKKTPKRTVKIK